MTKSWKYFHAFVYMMSIYLALNYLSGKELSDEVLVPAFLTSISLVAFFFYLEKKNLKNSKEKDPIL